MLILPPFTVGDTATLYAPRDYVCHVTAPDGSTQVLITPSKRVDIGLTMAGTYEYVWSDGTTGELVAVAAEPVSTVIP